ncbi:signal recognition particle, SRP9/SRP14 subunit [Martensiomyces pterosporus]|nr:signal recognition particle, SRP9/SRP14 subunit [Martensiomyces pterosporus]
MLVDNEQFLKTLPGLFADTKESGGVGLSIKRYDYQGKKQERQKKRKAQGRDDETMRLLVDELSLDDKEYAVIARAATEKKKLSTLVAPADLDTFLAHYHGVFLACVDGMKKKERLRRKKAAVKKQAAKKARAKTQAQAKAKTQTQTQAPASSA